MHDVLRERLARHLEALPEAQLYQVLDYIEFLSSKYARDRVRPPASPFQRFGERLEDRLRGNGVGLGAIRGTLEAMGTADRVVSGITEAGRTILKEVGDGLLPPAQTPRPSGSGPRAVPRASPDASRPAPDAPGPPAHGGRDVPVDG